MGHPIHHRDILKVGYYFWRNWKGIYHRCWVCVVAISDYHQQSWHLCIHFIVTYLVLNQVTNEEKYESWSCGSAARVLAYVVRIRPLASSPAPHKAQCCGACLLS